MGQLLTEYGIMSMLSPQQMVDAIAGRSGKYHISSTVTFTLNDDDGEMQGYLAGSVLDNFLSDLINQYLGAVNKQRIQNLNALTNGSDSYTFTDIAAAAIDPLITALCSDDGRIVHFCHRAILLDHVDIDQQLWWTPALRDCLDRLYKELNCYSPHINPRKAASLNYTLYHIIGRDNSSGWLNKVPVPRQVQQDFRHFLIDVSTAIIRPSEPIEDSTFWDKQGSGQS